MRDSGKQFTVAVDGDCLKVTVSGQEQRFCGSQVISLLESSGTSLTADQKTAIEHVLSAIPKIGVVTVQSGGKWFVDPIRTYADLSTTVYKAMSGNDVFALLELSKMR